MMGDPYERKDFWFLSLLPVIAAVTYFSAWRAGIAPSISVLLTDLRSGSTGSLGHFGSFGISSPPWTVNASHALQANGMVLGVSAVGMIAGVVLFTWLVLLVIDAKRATVRWIENHQRQNRGAVTGILRPAEPVPGSSEQVIDVSAKPYQPRFSRWVRHTFEQDHTSGALRID